MNAFRYTLDKTRRIARVQLSGDDQAVALASFEKSEEFPFGKMCVRLLRRGSAMYVGEMQLNPRRPHVRDMDPTCLNHYERLRPALYRANVAIYRVRSSDIYLTHLWRHGYGVLMYAAALLLADMQGTGIGSDECFYGSTSRRAGRVWESRHLASIADVMGDIAFLKRR
jgi:hypothetical protein